MIVETAAFPTMTVVSAVIGDELEMIVWDPAVTPVTVLVSVLTTQDVSEIPAVRPVPRVEIQSP